MNHHENHARRPRAGALAGTEKVVGRWLGLSILGFAVIAGGAGCDDAKKATDAGSSGGAGGNSGGGGGGGGRGGGSGTDGGTDASGVDGGSASDAGTDVPVDGAIAVSRPEARPFSDTLAATLKVPAGFRASVFARDLTNPRMLALGPDGSIYVTMPMPSRVMRLIDANADGDASDAGESSVVASAMDTPGLEGVHGIAIHQGKIYLASVKSVFSGTLTGGTVTGLQRLIADLPDGGQHPNRTLAVGPDGNLYVSVGSSCNACPETNSEHATMLRVTLTGTVVANPPNSQHPMLAHNPMAMISPRVFASGLRNTIGFDWHPTTQALWGSDIGSDGLGDDMPQDEVNTVEGGAAHGWPYCWGQRQIDPVIDNPSKTLTKAAYCAMTTPSVAGYTAHSSPIAFLFYRGSQFPTEYSGDAFVALRGSWNRSSPVGYKVVRVHFANGVPTPLTTQTNAVQDFLTGFLVENGRAHFGRIAGLAVDATGALLVSEDTNGVIYRVSYGMAADGGVGPDAPDGGAGGSDATDAPSVTPDATVDVGPLVDGLGQ